MSHLWKGYGREEKGEGKTVASLVAAALLKLENDPNDLQAQTELAEA